jgi:hypothetical protein
MRYARRTKVTVQKSRSEIETICLRYKADQFGSAFDGEHGRAMIQFRIATWLVRFILPLPQKNEQDQRQRWRALALAIKAKLEAVESGITTFEEEFMPHIVMPSGQTVGEWAVPQLRDLKEKGKFSTSISGLIEGQK